MQVKTPEEFFETVLPKRFDPNKARGIQATIQVDISGTNGGKWIINIKDQRLNVKKGTDQAPTITIQMSDENYLDLLNGKLSAEKAFFSGKIKFKGDLMLALRLRDIGFL